MKIPTHLDTDLIDAYGAESIKQANLIVAQHAQKEICIFSYALDAHSFNQMDFVETIKRLVLKSQYCHVRILLQNPRATTQNAHRLLDFGRFFSSRVKFRQCNRDSLNVTENFLLADATGYVLQQFHQKSNAKYNLNDSTKTRLLYKQFQKYWDRGQESSELRRFTL